MVAGEFQERALADSGIAGDDEHPAPAVSTVVQELQELLALAVTADQHDQMLVVYRAPILPAGSGAEEQKAVNGALRAYSCATVSGWASRSNGQIRHPRRRTPELGQRQSRGPVV